MTLVSRAGGQSTSRGTRLPVSWGLLVCRYFANPDRVIQDFCEHREQTGRHPTVYGSTNTRRHPSEHRDSVQAEMNRVVHRGLGATEE